MVMGRGRRVAVWWARAALLSVLLSTAGVVSLVSCGESRAAGVERLEFWTISLKPRFTGYIEGQIAAFEGENPGVDVVWVDVPYGAVERKFVVSSAAGRGPDVVNMSDLFYARFSAAGAFASLEGLLPGEAGERYKREALAVCRIGGSLTALPWYLTTQALIMNEGVLARGGLRPDDVPGTWRGLAALALEFRRATEAAGEPAYLFSFQLGHDSELPIMMMADGIELLRAGAGGGLEPNLTSAAVVEYVSLFVELYRAGGLPRESATAGFEHVVDHYQNGRIAVLSSGPNFLDRVRGVSPAVYEASVVRPAATGELGRGHIAVMMLCVTAASERRELAARLAWFMTGPAAQLAFSRQVAVLPSTPESLEDGFFEGPTAEEVASGNSKLGEARAMVAETVREAAAFTPALESWSAMRRAFEAELKRSLLDGVPVERSMERANAAWAELLRELGERRASAGASPVGIEVVPRPGRLLATDGRAER